MNKLSPEFKAIETAFDQIMESELFRLNGPALDLPEALITLADAINEYDGETEDWCYLGDSLETSADNLIVGAYWALSEWHAGQSSDSYRALCALGSIFSPGHTSAPESEEESEWSAYDAVNQWFETNTFTL